MPVAHVHLVAGTYPVERLEDLQAGITSLYCEVLSCPVDRVRVFVVEYPAGNVMSAGRPVTSHEDGAPYFTMRLLSGRPPEQARRLLEGVSNLLAEVLGYELATVRGELVEVDPAHWAIGGRVAADVRGAEIRARKDGGARR
ncbi:MULTISPECIES: tautomerase family protein [unclassified Dietzia]|uniref:tautomerase family protein n=1 Tax=unclassified Dietzia TaxID=2617939 RepID=UPI001318F8F0|nr:MULTISPECIES: tautomerase family protein [unclassified Dietzia]QGW23453.1 hypothetical protein GJR88_00619 [Dietzia sp. DQ12-45-1b]